MFGLALCGAGTGVISPDWVTFGVALGGAGPECIIPLARSLQPNQHLAVSLSV